MQVIKRIRRKLAGFINSVKENDGYYIARYEASGKAEQIVKSKRGQEVWTEIKQPDAETSCQGIYGTAVNSALMNSYAFDTAILFLQKQSSQYAIRQSANDAEDGLLLAGESGDVQCNIYDLASNCYEWTTEIFDPFNGADSCVVRGDAYNDTNNLCASSRKNEGNTTNNTSISFRPILYL